MSERETFSHWLHEPAPKREAQPHACFCIGPQNGQPECPCRMRARGGGITLSYDELARLINRRKMRK